ncbi:MAG: WecB/TagA/CpsF family glycosyltransferase [Candidatus Komeilibacteria bacterium]|nr:WecB/TagA/CpsF family glycosyltransferase [Candidatus Komeilibacteria bacterium]
MKSTYLLGVRLDCLTTAQVYQQCRDFLISPIQKNRLIVTVNSEFIVLAQTDQRFKDILNKAELCLVDTTGVVLMAKLFLGQWLNRLPGADFFWPLLKLAKEQGSGVYFLGGRQNSSQKTAEIVQQKYPTLKVVGFNEGPQFQIKDSKIFFNEEQSKVNDQVLAEINQQRPEVLLVAFGAPKQEYWLAEYLNSCPSVKIAIGVGGTFDFVAGLVARAPQSWRSIGLEWLWRLICEPWRYRRIFTALIKFPFLCFNYYIINKKIK